MSYVHPVLGRYMWVSREEWNALQEERRRANRDFDRIWVSISGLDPLDPKRQWGKLQVSGRDRDGSIVAAVRIERAAGTAGYVRKLRIVPHHTWPRGSDCRISVTA